MVKAVVVGINEYPDPSVRLSGCVNDAMDVAAWLVEKHGLAPQDIHPLTDGRATKVAIVTALRDMIASSSPGDHLLFHFSGHGSRRPSSDPNEADGLDELLCPVDFDWNTPSTAFTEAELWTILATVPAGTAMTVVLDACHSGSRAIDANMKPRFYPQPPDIKWRLAARKRVVHTRDMKPANAMIVAACAASETAADTSFGDRPNGAFTFHWLAQLEATPVASVDDLVMGVSAKLASFNMHPEDDGGVALEAASFLITPPPKPRDMPALILAKASASRAPGEVVFDQGWSAKVVGVDVSVHVRISVDESGFQLILQSGAVTWPAIRVTGDLAVPLDLGFGFQLIVAVSGWTVRRPDVDFDLAVRVQPPALGPFPLPATTLFQQRLTLPLAATPRSLAAPTSASELWALMQLSQLQGGAGTPVLAGNGAISSAVSRPRGAQDPIGLQAPITMGFAGGLFGFSEEHIIPWDLDDNTVRADRAPEVWADPPGSLNVYFIDWVEHGPGSERKGAFRVHVGCAAFRGGTLNCRPYYLRVDISHPETQREAPAPKAALNGQSKTREPFEAPQPEGGGSVRV